MTVQPLSEPTPKAQFALYDILKKVPNKLLAEFDMLTGGDQTISMVSYNVIDALGNVTTKYIPGQTSFDPVVLLKAMDVSSVEMYERFRAAFDGKLKTLRQNYSISLNDSNGKALVWWHLINAIPTKIDGFDFNMRTEAEYTDFEISLQAEEIRIEFEAYASADDVQAAIEHWNPPE